MCLVPLSATLPRSSHVPTRSLFTVPKFFNAHVTALLQSLVSSGGSRVSQKTVCSIFRSESPDPECRVFSRSPPGPPQGTFPEDVEPTGIKAETGERGSRPGTEQESAFRRLFTEMTNMQVGCRLLDSLEWNVLI